MAKLTPEEWNEASAAIMAKPLYQWRPGQKDAWELFQGAKGKGPVALISGRRVGKAQPLDEPILTPDGWKPMGEIQVGDYVIGADGKPKQVNGVYPQGRKNVYKITFSNDTWTRACGEHLWQVKGRRDSPHRPYRVINTLNLKPREKGHTASGIQLCEPIEVASPATPTVPAYFLGAYLGDGGSTSYTIKFTSADPEMHERVLRESGLDPEHTSQQTTTKLLTVRHGDNNPLIAKLKHLGIHMHHSRDKFIPDECFKYSIEDRKELIRGLMDTDGYIGARVRNRNGYIVEYCSISKRLAEGVNELLLGLGVNSRIKVSTSQIVNGKPYTSYRIIFSRSEFNPFWLRRKAEVWEECTEWEKTRNRNESFKYVKTVEPDGEAECQCISVEGSLYITRGYTVTHNTANALRFLLYKMLTTPNIQCCFVGKTIGEAKQMAFNDPKFGILRLVPEAMIEKRDLGTAYIELVNGASLQLYGGRDSHKVRGRGFRLVIFDEPSFYKGGWDVIQNILIAFDTDEELDPNDPKSIQGSRRGN